jgi:hypothetical protein
MMRWHLSSGKQKWLATRLMEAEDMAVAVMRLLGP